MFFCDRLNGTKHPFDSRAVIPGGLPGTHHMEVSVEVLNGELLRDIRLVIF